LKAPEGGDEKMKCPTCHQKIPELIKVPGYKWDDKNQEWVKYADEVETVYNEGGKSGDIINKQVDS
jgi:hypothetical protein